MTSLFPYLILAVLFVRGITLEGSVQGIIYYLKPEFHRLLSAQVSNTVHLSQTRVPQTPICTGQSSSTTSNQSSKDSSLHRSVIIYLKPEFHRLLSAQVSHHLSQTRVPQTPLCTCQSSSTTSNQSSTDSSLHRSVIIYYLKQRLDKDRDQDPLCLIVPVAFPVLVLAPCTVGEKIRHQLIGVLPRSNPIHQICKDVKKAIQSACLRGI